MPDMRQRGGTADVDGAPSPDSPQGRRRTSLRRWVAGALTLLAAGVLLWVFGGVSPDDTRSSPLPTHQRLPRPSSSSSSSSDATAQPSLPPLPTQQKKETAAPAALDATAPVRFGSEGVGVLGKLGVRARLRTLLKSGSDLCDMCGPTNPGAAAATAAEPWKDVDLERLPAFCKAQGADDADAVPHYEGNQLPLADDEVVLPERTAAIFVAIGTTLHGVDKKKKGEAGGGQDYLEHAVRQWRLFNPPSESVVYIVISDKYREDAVVLRWATEFEAEIVWESEIQATPYWKEYERVFYVQGYMHPGGSRKDGNKDFNKLVMQRFHVVHALMLQKKLTHVVHLENDILLYARWRDLLKPIVRCGHEMSSTFASPKGVIPSVVYIRSPEAIRKLVEFVNSLLSCGGTCLGRTKQACGTQPRYCKWTTKGSQEYSGACQPNFGYHLNKVLKMGMYANDMTYLMNYWQYFGASALSPLPAWEHKPGENCVFDLRPNEIYDLASFGQWYSFSPPDRDPPRPDKQYVQAMKKDRFLDPTPPAYLEWRTDAEGRRTPYWKQYKLLSMHVHAKNLQRFVSKHHTP